MTGGAGATILDNAGLTVSGSLGASAIALTGSNITLPGIVSDGGSGTVSLIATAGGIGQTGTLIAGTLSGSSTGATSLTGATPTANQIATLGNFNAGSDFGLRTAQDLSVAGTVTGNGVTLAAGVGLDVSGSLTGTTIGLIAGGFFRETGASIGAASITATAPAIFLAGGSVVTGNTAVPAGALNPGQIPDGTGPGLFLNADTITQTGTTTVNGSGIAGTVRVGARAGGSAPVASFSNLQAASSKLYLVLGSGTASGGVAVQGLQIAYGGGGGADLTGTVNGKAGLAASSGSFITPVVNSAYRMNGCVIGSATCLLNPVFLRPPALFLPIDAGSLQFFSSSSSSTPGSSRNASFSAVFPLTETGFGGTSGQGDDLDDILPDIADRDF